MPDWHLPVFDLTIANLRDRYLPRQVRIFRDFAAQMVPGLFASLPAGFIPADPEIAKAPSEWRNP
jgi:hypothetical protein